MIKLPPQKLIGYIISLALLSAVPLADSRAANETAICLDGFCIGQSIEDARFDKSEWVTPKKDLAKQNCNKVGCQPDIAFYGYSLETQTKLAEAVSWIYGANNYNIIRFNRHIAP